MGKDGRGGGQGGARERQPWTWEFPSFFLIPALGEGGTDESGRRGEPHHSRTRNGGGGGIKRGGDIGGVLAWG